MQRLVTTLAIAILLCGFANAAAAATCDPHTYGAKADGNTLDTAALQQAIDACAVHGGDVVLNGGTFLSAPLTLKSRVHLVIEKDATLLGSSNLNDYPVRTEKEYSWRRVALLHADNATDIAITGGGVVDGAGQVWWEYARQGRVAGDTSGSAGHPRPLLVDITHSNHILIDGVRFQNSPMYNLTFFQSSYIDIRNITINNPATGAPNTDGIDPFYSHHITISNVTIDTGDDCIAIKSGLVERGEPTEPTTDVTVRNSTMLHGHGLSIGSETAGGVQNVLVQNVTFRGTTAGIRVKSNRGRGNDTSNLVYENITMVDVETPILLTEYYPKIPATDTAQPMAANTPRFHNIVIRQLTATGAKNAMTIAGVPESPIRDLKLENVSIQSQLGATIQNAHLTLQNVTVTPQTGSPITQGPGVEMKVLP